MLLTAKSRSRRRVVAMLVVTVVLLAGAGVSYFLPASEGTPQSQTHVVPAAADTYVNQRRPGYAYGDAEVLRVDVAPQTFRAYVRFELPDLREPATSATVRIRVRSRSAHGLTVHAVGKAWDELSTTWPTAPRAGQRLGIFIASGDTGWYEASVPVPAPGTRTVSVAIVGTAKTMVAFDSRETSAPPQLVVVEAAAR